jgi:arylsulfatase
VRYPGHVKPGLLCDEIVHITDMFTTIIRWAGLEIPKDRVIDGIDQRDFLEGKQVNSNRDGFPFWMGSTMYGAKWHQFKMVTHIQPTMTDPVMTLPTPRLINLDTDPHERKVYEYPFIHSWAFGHTVEQVMIYENSLKKDPNIPVGPL